MDKYMRIALDLGYLKKWGDNQYTITDAGQELAVAELSKPSRLGLALQILSIRDRDEQGSAFIGVILGVLRNNTNQLV